MHFVVNFRLASKYLLVIDSVCIIFATLLLYMKDSDGAFEMANSPELALKLVNAKIFYYANCIVFCILMAYIVFGWQLLLFAYLLGTFVYLLTRFYFAQHFYMLYNFPNILGLVLASFYLYVTYYEIDARKVFAVGSQVDFESSSDEYDRRLARSSRHLDDEV